MQNKAPLVGFLKIMMHQSNCLQVYEHDVLRVGDQRNGVTFSRQHFEALAAFAEWHSTPFFQLVHRGVRFAQYVGAVQVGSLTIEILPKTDRHAPIGHTVAQSVLLDMLRACRILQPKPGDTGYLRTRPGTLLDVHLEEFLTQVEQLLPRGLVRTYRTAGRNRPALKGPIHFPQHLQHNLTRRDRFFTRQQEFSYDHPYNRLLRQALVLLARLPLRSALQGKTMRLLRHFPELPPPVQLPEPRQLHFDRQTKAYESPLQLALLLLQHRQPDVRSGRLPILTLLFDMNALFEEFIFRQLHRAADEQMVVRRQVRRAFWEQRHLQPDILLEFGDERIILDTKWKLLQRASPDMEDLRQMFVYNQFFDAKRSILVYPQALGLQDLPPTPFALPDSTEAHCQIVFVELVTNERLNPQLGKELLQKIGSHH